MSTYNAERPSPGGSGSGFHLLSCPKLFDEGNNNNDNNNSTTARKYNDIHLNVESTEKLMSMLKDSLEHAHVLHAGGSTKRTNSPIGDAVERQIGSEKEVAINVPRRTDNAHLCTLLKTILDEQEEKAAAAAAVNNGRTTLEQEKQQGNATTAQGDGVQAVISIMKLENRKPTAEAIFLRGAQKAASLVDNIVMKISEIDEKVRSKFKKATTSDMFHLTKDAVIL